MEYGIRYRKPRRAAPNKSMLSSFKTATNQPKSREVKATNNRNYSEDMQSEGLSQDCKKCVAYKDGCRLGYSMSRRQHSFTPDGVCTHPKSALEFINATNLQHANKKGKLEGEDNLTTSN